MTDQQRKKKKPRLFLNLFFLLGTTLAIGAMIVHSFSLTGL
jgi:hypothetical protein